MKVSQKSECRCKWDYLMVDPRTSAKQAFMQVRKRCPTGEDLASELSLAGRKRNPFLCGN